MPGLNLVPGQVVRLDSSRIRVPHQGWARVCGSLGPKGAPLTLDGYYYFSHGFRIEPGPGLTEYRSTVGTAEDIVAAYRFENILGMQFHPELSGHAGLRVLDQLITSLGNGYE